MECDLPYVKYDAGRWDGCSEKNTQRAKEFRREKGRGAHVGVGT